MCLDAMEWDDGSCAESLPAVCKICSADTDATSTFSRIRFNVEPINDQSGLRGGANTTFVHVSELTLYDTKGALTGGVASVPGGSSPATEGPAMINDGRLDTKWLDFTKKSLILTFAQPVLVKSYKWATANDHAERDPVKWSLEGSNDGTSWNSIDGSRTTQLYQVSPARNAWQGLFSVPVSQRQKRKQELCSDRVGDAFFKQHMANITCAVLKNAGLCAYFQAAGVRVHDMCACSCPVTTRPTVHPTTSPTPMPTKLGVTYSPTRAPTLTTYLPTRAPTTATSSPTWAPSAVNATARPTANPTTARPTVSNYTSWLHSNWARLNLSSMLGVGHSRCVACPAGLSLGGRSAPCSALLSLEYPSKQLSPSNCHDPSNNPSNT